MTASVDGRPCAVRLVSTRMWERPRGSHQAERATAARFGHRDRHRQPVGGDGRGATGRSAAIVARRCEQAGDRRLRRGGDQRRQRRLRAGRRADRHLRQRRHALDRAADLHPAPIRLRSGAGAGAGASGVADDRTVRGAAGGGHGEGRRRGQEGPGRDRDGLACRHEHRGIRGHRDRLAGQRQAPQIRPAVHRAGLSAPAGAARLPARPWLQDLHRLGRRGRVHAPLDRDGLWHPARAGGRLDDRDRARACRTASRC